MNYLSPIELFTKQELSQVIHLLWPRCKSLDLLTSESYDYMDRLGEILEIELEGVLSKHKYPMRLVRRESLFWLSGNPKTGCRV